MRIIFMGTPEFAVKSLEALIEAGEDVVAVVTAADKAAGRGQKVQQSAIKQYAVSQNIPVLQPEKLKNTAFLEELASYQAELQVVVAFRMLPEAVWNMPPLGTINVHASLLPQYRGAAPINHAVINGEKETGVTTFLLQHEIDTGNILLSETVTIEETDTAGTLHDKLMLAGAETLLKTIAGIKANTITPTPQEQVTLTELKHAPKIFKEDCLIDWNHNTEHIFNKIRGLSPYPAAYTVMKGKTLKIFESNRSIEKHTLEPGQYETDNKSNLRFATLDGFIDVLSLQIEGKKRMSTVEFLRGYRFE